MDTVPPEVVRRILHYLPTPAWHQARAASRIFWVDRGHEVVARLMQRYQSNMLRACEDLATNNDTVMMRTLLETMRVSCLDVFCISQTASRCGHVDVLRLLFEFSPACVQHRTYNCALFASANGRINVLDYLASNSDDFVFDAMPTTAAPYSDSVTQWWNQWFRDSRRRRLRRRRNSLTAQNSQSRQSRRRFA